ncbi:Regulator of volume decrease after cellular swelling domain containing protein [Rhypophila sp. PSN 637]
MLCSTIRTPPSLDDFTPLAEHLEQTPASFYDGKPVLHYHTTGAKAWIPKSQLGKLPFFPSDLSSEPTGPEGGALNGTVEENVEQKVDLFVSSKAFTIFSPAASSGLTIPYPEISIHAIKTIGTADATYPAVYLQLEMSEPNSEEEFETIELTLIPSSTSTTPTPSDTTTTATPEAKKLYEAIAECSNLNPDPVDQDDEDMEDNADRIVFEGEYQPVQGYEGVYVGNSAGGLPPPMPGSGGWITAENMHEYFDADGNWIGGGDVTVIGDEEEGTETEELGEGAGNVHARDEDDAAESKRPRVE